MPVRSCSEQPRLWALIRGAKTGSVIRAQVLIRPDLDGASGAQVAVAGAAAALRRCVALNRGHAAARAARAPRAGAQDAAHAAG